MYMTVNATYCADVGRELQRLLAAEEYKAFLGALDAGASRKLEVFSLSHDDLVKKIVRTTRSSRSKLLDRLPVEQRFWATAAAAEMAFQAADVLEAVRRTEICDPRTDRHDLIAAAHDVLAAPWEREDYLWPFPVPRPAEQI